MALSNFKNIITNKAYLINSKDREIFEKGDYQSFFGLSKSDAIEFIIYDVNNNQLPQKSADNKLVRYVPLTTDNIKDYFLIATDTVLQKNKLPAEYFIDAERLIQEAGYNNGIFKTQITLVNHRAGSNKPFDKLWIQEISPSRKEIRLQPLSKGVEVNPELKERFNVFVYDGNFREDTQPFIDSFLAKIKTEDISNVIMNKYTSPWFTKMKNEYSLTNFSQFIIDTHSKFLEACKYEFSNKESNVTSAEYGKQKLTPPSVGLSKKQIIDICTRILIQILDSKMIKPVANTQLNVTQASDASLDKVSKILQRVKSDTYVDTSLPTVETATIQKDVVKDANTNILAPDAQPISYKLVRNSTAAPKDASVIEYLDGYTKQKKSIKYDTISDDKTTPYTTQVCALSNSFTGNLQYWTITQLGYCSGVGDGGGGGGKGDGGGSTVCYTYVNNSYDSWIGDYTDCDGNYISGAQLASYSSICAVRGTPYTKSGGNLTLSVACYPGGGNGVGGGNKGGGGGNTGGGGGGNTGGGGGGENIRNDNNQNLK
jgi:hypothetical protein